MGGSVKYGGVIITAVAMEEDECGNLGVMIYGYDGIDAKAIGDFLRAAMGADVDVIGGSGREMDTVRDIIGGEADNAFKAEGTRILMFLGFDDDRIGMVLSSFPKDMPRPIFCGLTENNVGWKLSELIEHLLEEQRYWAEKNRNSS